MLPQAFATVKVMVFKPYSERKDKTEDEKIKTLVIIIMFNKIIIMLSLYNFCYDHRALKGIIEKENK